MFVSIIEHPLNINSKCHESDYENTVFPKRIIIWSNNSFIMNSLAKQYAVWYICSDTKTNVSYKLLIDNLMNKSEILGLNIYALMRYST